MNNELANNVFNITLHPRFASDAKFNLKPETTNFTAGRPCLNDCVSRDRSGSLLYVRVHGDSMINAGIESGERAIVNLDRRPPPF